MEGLSGPDTAAKMLTQARPQEDISQCPIIAITGYRDEKYKLAAKEAGMSDFLTKPVRQAELLMLLRKWLQNKNASGTASIERELGEMRYDETLLIEFRTAMPDKFSAYIESVLADMNQSILQLKSAIDDKNFDSIHDAAHALASSSGQVGALKFSKMTRDIENLAHKTSGYKQIQQRYEHLEKEMQDVKTWLYGFKS